MKNKIHSFDFIPATLKKHKNGDWLIVYHIKINDAPKYKRIRRRVKKLKPYSLRLEFANKEVEKTNKHLATQNFKALGLDYSFTDLAYIADAIDMFIEHTEKKFEQKIIRKDTLRSYVSFCKMYKIYLEKINGPEMKDFTKDHVIYFVDYLEIEKKLNPRTINNYISMLNMVCKYLIDHGHIENNPATSIKKRKLRKKQREVIPKDTLKIVFLTIKTLNPDFYTLCLMTYVCFIRRTELTLLKVKHINLREQLINVPPEVSKNKKNDYVTIPDMYMDILAHHIRKANNEDYIFSAENFRAGQKKLAPKKISDTWAKFRKELDIKNTYQFYALKDTGITELFHQGVPIIKIRDQARHYDINITELYTPRQNKADSTISKIYYDL